ncbi:MAG TPA: D-alanyl-D-alanine carboxypeptidase/D-alanyl-D-alanine-endopeptidase [Gemmatimonadaceae bacterium]|nr:D-alanyl-D-alanine carboxypeptidase/D-alanyl-D-alanine-endopeptidase [Gemmatimonadaceae bacterium]
MFHNRASMLCAAVLALAACRAAPGIPGPARISTGADASLRAFIDSMTDAPQFSNAHWGILIVDPERGDTLYARNAGKLFMPASNMKILTSATALTQLGPDYRYRTSFVARGPVAEGTLDGDLLVIGRGDPSVSDHMLHDAMLPLRAIADSLAAKGIRHIRGRVVSSGNAFPGEVFGFGWTYDDLEDSYSAPVDELLFNEGYSELHVRGGDNPGDSVRVEVSPARSFPRVHVTATTIAPTPGDTARARRRTLRARKDSTTWDVILEGEIAARDTTTIEVTHHDPGAAYIAAVREVLRDKAITVDDSPTDTSASQLDTLATLSSPPLSEILKALMKPSQNQIAEMLFRTVALEKIGAGRGDSARAIVERQIGAWGVPVPAEAIVRDGSGLARYDYISPRTAVRILDAMRRAPTFAVYYDALPIAGVDGTIRSRMKSTPAENNVHAKTGTVAQARSLSGYVTTADRHMLIFSFLCNNFTVPNREVERVQDAIAARLAAMRLR